MKAPSRTIVVALIALLGSGCAIVAPFHDEDEEKDTTAPAKILDLDLATSSSGRLLLQWTAPGDDRGRGIARAYDLRFQPADESPLEWERVTHMELPSPAPGGLRESVPLDPLFQEGDWLLALRAVDDAGNWSPFSPPLLVEEAQRPYPAPVDESTVVENLSRAWSSLHADEYESLLARDFQFWFAPEDVDLVPDALYWDRAAELRSAQALLGGQVGTRPDGSPMPPAASIEVTLTPFDEEWVDASDEVVGGLTTLPEGTRRRRYDSEIRIHHAGEDLVSVALGSQVFYVAPLAQEIAGGTEQFELVVWHDYGNWRPADLAARSRREPVTWGQIKVRY